jgi:hypothetical protein
LRIFTDKILIKYCKFVKKFVKKNYLRNQENLNNSIPEYKITENNLNNVSSFTCEKQTAGNKDKIETDLKDQNIDEKTFAHSSIFIDPWQESETEKQNQHSISAEPSQNNWADFGKFN